jgi:RNA-binding protein NOB1
MVDADDDAAPVPPSAQAPPSVDPPTVISADAGTDRLPRQDPDGHTIQHQQRRARDVVDEDHDDDCTVAAATAEATATEPATEPATGTAAPTQEQQLKQKHQQQQQTQARSPPPPAPPSTAPPTAPSTAPQPPAPPLYYAVVLDSGPIIRGGGNLPAPLRGATRRYVTVPGVLGEIRDSKSRGQLAASGGFGGGDSSSSSSSSWNDLVTVRECTEWSLRRVVRFARQTGDYASLSRVDLQVLALTLDMEREGCNGVVGGVGGCGAATEDDAGGLLGHIRTTPKRRIGLGVIHSLNPKDGSNENRKNSSREVRGGGTTEQGDDVVAKAPVTKVPDRGNQPSPSLMSTEEYDVVEESDDDDDDDDEDEDDHAFDDDENEEDDDDVNEADGRELGGAPPQQLPALSAGGGSGNVIAPTATEPATEHRRPHQPSLPLAGAATGAPRSWAAMVDPAAVASVAAPPSTAPTPSPTTFVAGVLPDPILPGCSSPTDAPPDGDVGGDGGGQFDDAPDDDVASSYNYDAVPAATTLELELPLGFPSPEAAATLPVVGETAACSDGGLDDARRRRQQQDQNQMQHEDEPDWQMQVQARAEEAKLSALRPVSKSGKLYNSFRKYKNLMTPNPLSLKKKKSATPERTASPATQRSRPQEGTGTRSSESKIRSGGGIVTSETMKLDEDDGVGWITSLNEIRAIKTLNGGLLHPIRAGSTFSSSGAGGDGDSNDGNTDKTSGPPLALRSACATTDFAMQNVLLQMNLLLLSVDGVRIRRLKSWVIRCGACFKIHSTEDDFNNGMMRRLFCAHCGSGDIMQRIAASVDGKSGRLKLHFSKRKQGKLHSIRGTKFSLPKPGSGNRFQGDLLLREDQLLTGAWNQKVKIRSGGSSRANRESMFGKDLASNVGCCKPNFLSSAEDICVGFGSRKNPNASKGRERRGKKKKSSDRACGLRRY